jgi:formate-nitrite transporter family protein
MTLTDPVRLREVRGQLGPTDAPAEDQLAEAFETIVSEGTRRLHRTWREMIPPDLAGGLEGATGVLALRVDSPPDPVGWVPSAEAGEH